MTTLFAIALPQMTTFAAPPRGCSSSFLGLEPWFNYLPDDWFGGQGYGTCDINSHFQFLSNGSESGLLLIGMAVLDDLLRIAALVAVGFVVYGGIQFVTSQGSPDAVSKARQTIINALIGLAVAIVAASLVAFIGNQLGG